ncbi:MAG: hypothetical protein IPH75_14545 [bacterium]|nr:hypothetical protein [bacterium]
MEIQPSSNNQRSLPWWAILMLILLTGVSLRVADLTADLPGYFASKSQDLTTDGSFLTLYARNQIEQGSWDPLGYTPWREFKLSLVTGVSYLTYTTIGVSRYASNLVGVILSAVGLILFLFALAPSLSRRGMAYASVALAVSYPLIIYSRTPLSENSLIFFLGLIYLVLSRFSRFWWGILLAGALAALAGLLGKSSGFLLLGPLLIVTLARSENRTRSSLLVVASFLTASLVYSLLFLGERGLLQFILAHTVAQPGAPVGLSSPIGFIETIISFGRSRIHQLAPVESLLAYLGVLSVILRGMPRTELARTALLFNLGLVLLWILGIAPFNYLPMRYALLILPSLTALGALWLDRDESQARVTLRQIGWSRRLALLLLNWYLLFVLANSLISETMVYDVIQRQVWYALAGAVLVTIIQLLITGKLSNLFSASYRGWLMPACVVAVIAISSWQVGSWWGRRTHTIDEAVRDIAAVVGKDAAIGGPYGPVLADGNGRQGFPLFIAEDFDKSRDILKKYGVTHLALLNEDWQRLQSTIPEMRKSSVVAKYWLRDNTIVLVRVAGLFGGSAATYKMSSYELALLATEHGDNNTALALLQSAMAEYPDAKSPAISYYHLSVTPQSIAGLEPTIQRLLAANGSDFTINLLAAVYYRHLAQISGANQYSDRAEQLRAEAVRLCPENETVVQNGFQHYDPTVRILQ